MQGFRWYSTNFFFSINCRFCKNWTVLIKMDDSSIIHWVFMRKSIREHRTRIEDAKVEPFLMVLSNLSTCSSFVYKGLFSSPNKFNVLGWWKKNFLISHNEEFMRHANEWKIHSTHFYFPDGEFSLCCSKRRKIACAFLLYFELYFDFYDVLTHTRHRGNHFFQVKSKEISV